MTYSVFLLVFIVPPILVLSLYSSPGWKPAPSRKLWTGLLLICLIAFTYTTPWDNYLVYRGVWGYGGTERVLLVIGWVPVEEYLFFVLQPILTGLLLYHVGARRRALSVTRANRIKLVGALVYAALTALGAALLFSRWENGLYMGLILAWACPVLAALWAYGGHAVWRRRNAAALAVAGSTLYLWVADWTAISQGIWTISDRYSLNVDPFGLPIEEATFFLVTNLLVAQGLVLFWDGDWIARPDTPEQDSVRGVSAPTHP